MVRPWNPLKQHGDKTSWISFKQPNLIYCTHGMHHCLGISRNPILRTLSDMILMNTSTFFLFDGFLFDGSLCGLCHSFIERLHEI